MVWTAAVKIAYQGKGFMGSQRQPDLRTVEGELLRVLYRIHAISDVKQARFRMASRTDAGVNALGNVVCFDTEFGKDKLLKAMNSVSDGVYCYALAEVPPDFSPRRAQRRWYRYHLARGDLDVHIVQECAKLFIGKHDFVRFCKPDGKSTLKTIERIDVTPVGEILVIDLYAREFLRNMVRRIVAAMDCVGQGKASLAEVRETLMGKDISFGLADPHGLLLMDISYNIDIPASSNLPLVHNLEEMKHQAWIDLFFFDDLQERIEEPSH
jgi:tRNA pseudouridine38-40 synthase